MIHPHLATYLNDHLAGASAALDMLSRLEQSHADKPIATFLTILHTEIDADRQELEALMTRLGVAESRSRRAAAWLGEQMAHLKLEFDDQEQGTMNLFESLEALSLGIVGKRALWQALATVSASTPELQGVDYARLTQRADAQHHQVETERLRAAQLALSTTSAQEQ